MKTRLALQGALGLLCAIAGGLQEAAVCGQTPSQNQPAGSPGKLLYQEVVVAQKSACRVQGLDSRYDLRYAVLSSLTIHERNNGRLDVEQKVEAAKLLQADEATQALFSNLLQKLTGTRFTMGFSPERELIRFEGAKDRLQAAAGPAVGQAILLASLIDRDGWKELARYSFFQPHKPLRPGARWEQSMTHSLGLPGELDRPGFLQVRGARGRPATVPLRLQADLCSAEAGGPRPALPGFQGEFQARGGRRDDLLRSRQAASQSRRGTVSGQGADEHRSPGAEPPG